MRFASPIVVVKTRFDAVLLKNGITRNNEKEK